MGFFGFLRRRRESGAKRETGEQAREWHVPSDITSIQGAIDAASDGDTVVVEPGRYHERLNFSGKNITVRSTDPASRAVVDATIVDGERKGSVVIFESGETAEAVLSGLTITNGLASFSSEHPGGGVTVINESAPVIERNVICDNVAELDGGGVYIDNSWPCVRRNRIENNRATGAGGGIHIGRDFVPVAEVRTPEPSRESYARFLDAMAPGPPQLGMQQGDAQGPGAMAGLRSGVVDRPVESERLRAQLEGNTVAGNTAFSGGGIHVADDAPTIEGNAVRDNRAERGGGMTFWDNSRPVVGKNYIAGNAAGEEGGGIMVEWGASPAIVANRLVENCGPKGPGISVAENARPVIRGNHFVNNESDDGRQLFLWTDLQLEIADNRYEPAGAGDGVR